MFEAFTQTARQVIFFARYEASQYGSTTIETEHLLLGLIRADNALLRRILPGSETIAGIREKINQLVEIREKTSTSIDMSLSDACKRILSYASEESRIVGTGQIVLGILREENCLAAKTLAGMGLHIDAVREEISRTPPAQPGMLNPIHRQPQTPIPETPLPADGVAPDAITAMRIAEAVWAPRMPGTPPENIVALNATLTFGVWVVTGSGKSSSIHTSLGAFIQKEDGIVLRLHQEQLDS